jgi:5-methylcytosine-specific restriction endonuclease McrA
MTVSIKQKNIPIEDRVKIELSNGAERWCFHCKSRKPSTDFKGKGPRAKCKACREPGLASRQASSKGVIEKACNVCKKTLPIDSFYIKKTQPYADGSPRYYSSCRECHYSKYVCDWTSRNYKAYRNLIKDWQLANPEKMKEYRSRNLEGKDLHFFWHHQQAKSRCQEVKDSTYYDFTLEDLKKHWEASGIDSKLCYYHGHNAGCDKDGEQTFDHIVPISQGGNHEVSNLVPCCRSCNSSKGIKDEQGFISWLKEAGRHTTTAINSDN